MIGSVNGLGGLCKSDDRFPDFWNFQCIIHREQLVSKTLNLDHVMKVLREIVNYISTHALNHRQFKNLLSELDADLPGDLPLHCTMRWLSQGKVVSCFYQLWEAIKKFLGEKKKNYAQLSDQRWLLDLAFLVDVLSHLDKLKMDLQMKLKTLPDVAQCVFAFVNKLKLFIEHVKKSDLTHFPSLRNIQHTAAVKVDAANCIGTLLCVLKICSRKDCR